MSLSNEFVFLREALETVPLSAKWKVTARYNVQTEPTVLVRCVRVRVHHKGIGLVRHFSEAEFERLFSSTPGDGVPT